MRITILGGGGVGGYLAARLAQAQRPVTLLARGGHLAAIQRDGLRLNAFDGTHSVRVDVREKASEPADLLVVAVKAYDLESAVQAAAPAIGPRTLILPLQNGVDASERIAKVSQGRVLGGIARIVASIAAPGVVQASIPLHLTVGAIAEADREDARAVSAALDVPGVKVVHSEDVRVALWTKFLFICGFSGMTCLCRTSIGPVLAHPESSALLERVMREVDAIARARGVPLAPHVVDEQLAACRRMSPDAPSSMLVDLRAGKRLELDALNAAAGRLGRAAGVETPANDAVVAALRPWAQGAAERPVSGP